MKQVLIIIFSCWLLQTAAQPVKQYGALHVKGTQLTASNGVPVVLHGMSFGWHNLWPRFYNKGAVKELVQHWNCTVIRASMGIELNDSGYLASPKQSEKLIRKVVDACIKNGVYVIVDWHDHNLHEQEAIGFFSRMAARYGKYPNVIWEIFNEPDYETWPAVKAYAEKVIAAIREKDPDNIILVGSPKWDQDIHLPAADPIKGYDNLMYTVHFYAATHKKWLRDRTDAAIQAGLPVFISECAGMEATGDGPIDEDEWATYVHWMDTQGLSWVAWSVSDKKETCSVLEPAAAATGKWPVTVIKTWGRLVQTYLLRYR